MESAAALAEKENAFVYLLQCADGTLYAGWTNDLAHRVKAHQTGKGARYTRARLPVKLVYWERLPSKSAALKREAALKKLSRQEKLQLIAHSRLTPPAV
ncbi:MAG: GIY-YIG nuclease family protein [Oscillospiraceae bacterium]|nr:GIY-YIG nuclease family protein [Oscillospiraceae bacterium]